LRSARELDAEAARAHHLASSAGSGAGPGAAGSPPKGPVGPSWLVKLGVWVGVPLVVVAALVLRGSTGTDARPAPESDPSAAAFAPPTPSPGPPPSLAPSASSLALSIEDLPSVSDTPSASARALAKAPVAAGASSAEAPPGTLADEVALLAKARAALVRGDGPGCLADLDTYARQFPRGALSLEASVLRIEALYTSGRRDEGRAAATAFLARNPNSAFSPRVRALVGPEVP